MKYGKILVKYKDKLEICIYLPWDKFKESWYK